MLNAIESCWSILKNELKQQLQNRYNELIAGDVAGALTQGEFRLRFLETLVDNAMPLITPNSCMQFYNHVQRLFARAIQREDMPVGQ